MGSGMRVPRPARESKSPFQGFTTAARGIGNNMATRRFGMNLGDTVEQVQDVVGAATVARNIEITIDQAALITDGTAAVSPRAIKRGEVMVAMRVLEQAILKTLNLN